MYCPPEEPMRCGAPSAMRTDHGDQQRDRGARPTIHRLHAESEASRRLAAIPGLGIITETAIAATLTKDLRHGAAGATLFPDRSDEHTSELQSLMRISYAVFCLKKKTRH